jgi:hypothetical protein
MTPTPSGEPIVSKLTLAFIALALSACSSFAEPKAWLFVQSVGGIEIGTPLQKETGWILPVRSDVSGLQTIAVKPTALNSGLSCQRTEATIEDNAIFLTIFTGVAGGGRSSVCPSASLGHPRAGKYSVFYRSSNEKPVAIGEISIGL